MVCFKIKNFWSVNTKRSRIALLMLNRMFKYYEFYSTAPQPQRHSPLETTDDKRRMHAVRIKQRVHGIIGPRSRVPHVLGVNARVAHE